MTQMIFGVQVILLSFILGACMLLIVSAKPLENDSAEIVMKIEKVNGQLPGNKRRREEQFRTFIN